jgi:hypothetical protein
MDPPQIDGILFCDANLPLFIVEVEWWVILHLLWQGAQARVLLIRTIEKCPLGHHDPVAVTAGDPLALGGRNF